MNQLETIKKQEYEAFSQLLMDKYTQETSVSDVKQALFSLSNFFKNLQRESFSRNDIEAIIAEGIEIECYTESDLGRVIEVVNGAFNEFTAQRGQSSGPSESTGRIL